MLFLCLFLPIAKGCGDSDVYPYQIAIENHQRLVLFLDAAWLLMPYVFGGVTAVGVLVASIRNDWRLYRWWWRGYVGFASFMALAYWTAVGAEVRSASDDQWEPLAERWIAILFSVTFPLLSWLSYRNGRTWIVKTAFLQLAFAISCLAWFSYLVVTMRDNLRYGGYVSIAACGLLLAGAVLQWRFRRELQRW